MLKTKEHKYVSFIIVILFLSVLFYLTPRDLEKNQTSPSPEIIKITSLTNTSEQSDELLNLLKRVGPIQAQEEMLHSGLPFTGETHLLVHTIGNFIYEQFGPNGLTYCKDYFLSACHHAVILNTLGDNGIGGIVEALTLCDKVGGPPTLSQCAHGAGHGFVAWHDYDLLKALKMCDSLGENIKNFTYFNCYDGVFMENFWGVHNGAPSEKRWVKENDIYYPCNNPEIPEKYLRACWANQATLIFQHFKGDLKKTAEVCDTVKKIEYREMCYDNFFRQIHPMTQGSVEKVKSLCALASNDQWRDLCILANMGSYWSVGDRVIPYQICKSLTRQLQNDCWMRLASQIKYHFERSPQDRKTYCDKIEEPNYRKICQN